MVDELVSQEDNQNIWTWLNKYMTVDQCFNPKFNCLMKKIKKKTTHTLCLKPYLMLWGLGAWIS